MRFLQRTSVRLLFVSLLFVTAPVTLRNAFKIWCDDTDDFVNVDKRIIASHEQKVNSHFHQVPMHPFEPNQPKYLIILTYQRCGSSAVGQFFNSNPNAFYVFEPLDSLYSALYGTKQGSNVPSDLTTYANGTERKIPAMEVKEIGNFLRSFLTCDFDALPTEALALRYFFTMQSDFKASDSYISCLNEKGLNHSKCENLTEPYCGDRFGERSEDVLRNCNRLLLNSSAALPSEEIPPQILRRFTSYRRCMRELRLRVEDSCLPLLRNACSSRQVRVAKVVRAPMESMEPLLRTMPNFRVLHLVRDPRAVALSRYEFDWSGRSIYTMMANDSITHEAAIYCRDVTRDIGVRQELEKRYPGKIYSVVHDEIFSRTAGSIRNIYEFIDEEVHNDTWAWLQPRKSFSRGRFRWQNTLSFQVSREIFRNCRRLFQLVKSKKWLL